MRHHLARVAGCVCAAAQRRTDGSSGNAGDGGTRFSALIETLQADYGDTKAFIDPYTSVNDDDRFAGFADVFGLDAVDELLVAIVVAPDLDANIALAYGLLTGRTEAVRPTIGLALELAAIPTADPLAIIYLGETASLRKPGLVQIIGDGPRLVRTLRSPDRLVAYLLGDDTPAQQIADMTVAAVPIACPTARLIQRAFDAGARLVWLHSQLGTAGLATASGAFAVAGLRALVIDARRHADPATLAEAFRQAALDAALAGQGLVVNGAEVLGEPDAAGAARVLRDAVVPVIAVGDRAWEPRWLPEPVFSTDAPSLTPAERGELWQEALGESGYSALAGLRMTPEEIVDTSRYARTLAAARDTPLDVATVRDAARLVSGGAGSGAPRTTTAIRASLDDLVLPEHVHAELQRLVAWAAHRDEVLARGPVHGKGGKAGGIAALFSGSPGTGKTLAAHAIADELNIELFQVDLSSVIDKYIGETEKNLERIFHQAESRNVVLFFDEADALFGSRSEVRDARDRYANQEVSYLLQRIEHFDGITVLATNLRGNLDLAFSRRMQFVVHFPDPDEATRARLWSQHLLHAGNLDVDDPVDIGVLAGPIELSGGDIRNIVLAATYDAVSLGETVGMRHVRAAAVREYHKLGRSVPSVIAR